MLKQEPQRSQIADIEISRRAALQKLLRLTTADVFLWAASNSLAPTKALARDPNGKWAEADPERSKWFEGLTIPKINPQTGKIEFNSCCSSGDVVETKFKVNKNHPYNDEWSFRDSTGKWVRVPEDTILWGKKSPDGKGYLFANSVGKIICFVPPNCEVDNSTCG